MYHNFVFPVSLVYDFVQFLQALYTHVQFRVSKENNTYYNNIVICINFLIHEVVHGTYFDTYYICIKYFSTYFDTRTDVFQNLWCIHSCIKLVDDVQ